MYPSDGVDTTAALTKAGWIGLGVVGVVVWVSTLPVVLNPGTRPEVRVPAVVEPQDHTHPESESAPATPKNCVPAAATGSMTNATGEDCLIWDSAGRAWRVVRHP